MVSDIGIVGTVAEAHACLQRGNSGILRLARAVVKRWRGTECRHVTRSQRVSGRLGCFMGRLTVTIRRMGIGALLADWVGEWRGSGSEIVWAVGLVLLVSLFTVRFCGLPLV